MAVVYRAVDPETRDHVAVKAVAVTRPLNLACFRREIHALGRMTHPGIVRIRDQGVDQGLNWCAMDLVEGTPFRRLFSGEDAVEITRTSRAARVRRQSPLRGRALVEVLGVLQRLCAPLAFLHGEGLVHRDLKPENVVVRSNGIPGSSSICSAWRRDSAGSSPAKVSAEVDESSERSDTWRRRRDEASSTDARVDIYGAPGWMRTRRSTGRPAGAGIAAISVRRSYRRESGPQRPRDAAARERPAGAARLRG